MSRQLGHSLASRAKKSALAVKDWVPETLLTDENAQHAQNLILAAEVPELPRGKNTSSPRFRAIRL
jgi:hypothetical protein